jgi:hypothetical protein
MDWFLQHLVGEWSVLAGAPMASFSVAVVLAAVIWMAMNWAYGKSVAGKNSVITDQQTTITNLRAEIADLKAGRCTSSDQSSTVDPDAILQVGRQVGRVQGAEINRSQGEAKFMEILGGPDFNDKADFVYRDMTVRISGMVSFTKGNMLGNRTQRFTGVVCQIVGGPAARS